MRILRFSRSLHSQRRARLTRRGGSEPERRPVPGTFLSRDGLRHGKPIIRTFPGPICDFRRALLRRAGPSANKMRRHPCRQHVQTGRRLMRQTVLPTKFPERIAPTRSESSARRVVPVGQRSARRTRLRFGLPLTPESGGPSRHPAAQFARATAHAPAAAKSSKMPNKMLIDATHPEETRVVVVRGNRVEEFDFETAKRKQLRGNIYLAKVTRVEPSLQAAFVEYGGNRHGFLAFSEIHPDYYQIPVADRQALIEADERAHREAEEESENRSSRRRRSRHRNSRRRGHGERVQSEIVGAHADRRRPPSPSRTMSIDAEAGIMTPRRMRHEDHAHEDHDHREGHDASRAMTTRPTSTTSA